ncbi:MAG: hypothetical protein A2Y12_20765 [Planctomycetes bacterium GWF2_42_9]|nr:MAG: hypothetical protein A2Y12_20765 [Planctomycetes bacterium GWF2_42_9]
MKLKIIKFLLYGILILIVLYLFLPRIAFVYFSPEKTYITQDIIPYIYEPEFLVKDNAYYVHCKTVIHIPLFSAILYRKDIQLTEGVGKHRVKDKD